MKRIIRNRDTGKTRELLESCASDPDAIVVCRHPERIPDKCLAYGIPTVRAIGYSDFAYITKNGVRSDREYHCYIDEIEKFMLFCIPEIKGYTLTDED